MMAAVFGGQAVAQEFDRDRNISVLERPRPDYDFGGRKVGGFTLLTELTAGVEFNDNVFATDDEPGATDTSDVIASAVPRARLQSDWSRHALAGAVTVDRREFIDESDESVTNAQFLVDGAIDVRRTTQITASAQYDLLNEPRTSSSSPRAIEAPVEFDVTTLQVGASHEVNRVRMELDYTVTTFDYDDAELAVGGAVVEQDDRDRETRVLTARADYALSPDRSIFVEASLDEREYDLDPPNALVDRDSNGWNMGVGVDFDLTNVARGEVAVGYVNQDIDDPLLKDINGVSVRGEVEWFVTALTTVTVGAGRTVEDTGVVGSAALFATTVSARVDHELLRNVILSGEVAYDEDEFESIERKDKRVRAYAGATYLLNRRVGVNAFVTRVDQSSSGPIGTAGPDYDVNRIGVNVRVQL